MKKLLSILLCSLLILCLIPAAAANDQLTIQITGTQEGVLVVDNANLLNEQEEQALLNQAKRISESQHCDVVILTENEIGTKSPMEYADDYFDYNGYGYGADRSGILLLLSMAERDWWLSTRGSAIQAFTDAGIEYISSKFLSDLSAGDYADGFRAYLNTADTMLSAYNGTLSEKELEEFQADFYRVTGQGPKPRPSLVKSLIIAAIIGLVLAFIPASFSKSHLTSVRKQYDASNYIRQNSMVLTRNNDRYLFANTTSRIIETQRSGGGGSSTHISSSGATHGGGGGKF